MPDPTLKQALMGIKKILIDDASKAICVVLPTERWKSDTTYVKRDPNRHVNIEPNKMIIWNDKKRKGVRRPGNRSKGKIKWP